MRWTRASALYKSMTNGERGRSGVKKRDYRMGHIISSEQGVYSLLSAAYDVLFDLLILK